MKSLSRVRLFVTPWTVAYHTRLLCPWNFPGNSTGVDCHFLLQGIFPNQGLNPGLPHCRQTPYCEPPGKPQSQVKYSKSGWGKLKTSDLMLLSKYKREPEAWNKHVVPYYESEATSSSPTPSISSGYIPGCWSWTPAQLIIYFFTPFPLL